MISLPKRLRWWNEFPSHPLRAPHSRMGVLSVLRQRFDPLQPETLYAGVYDSILLSRGLLKSTHSGASWFPSNAGLPLPLPTVHALLIDPLNPRHIHAGADAGCFVSLDAGAHWTAESFGMGAPDAPPISALTLTTSRQLLAATGDGIYRLDLSALNVVVPTLAITPAGVKAIVSWPADAGDFSLESAPSLRPPIFWSAVSDPISGTNHQQTVTVLLTNAAAFYRLMRP